MLVSTDDDGEQLGDRRRSTVPERLRLDRAAGPRRPELAAVQALRAAGPDLGIGRRQERAVDRVNAAGRHSCLAVAHPSPQQPEWHLHLASQADPLAQRMGAEMAMALADLIRAGELRRLKICAAPDCTAAVMDLSRNRSRIFCDTGNCGNRLHVAAYRERRAKEA
jgi:predicted RNA-binding Zn ribbon-like protein